MFQTHAAEFNLLLNDPNDSNLIGLLLHDQLKSYTKEELNHQLILLLLPYYTKKLQQLKFDEALTHREKSKRTIELKQKIIKLKSKKLIVI